MRSRSEILQEHYGVQTYKEANAIAVQIFRNSQIPDLSQRTKLKLPYEASSHPDIPSLEEIKEAMKKNWLSKKGGMFSVWRVGQCVVKMGSDEMIVQEAEDLIFLRENSQVRTPKVYAVFSETGELVRTYYMVMEFIEGENLDYIKWKSLGDEAKARICAKLSDQLVLLRSIPSEGYYGRVHNQGWGPNLRLLRLHGVGKALGPYNTYEEFLSAMYRCIELSAALQTGGTDEIEPYLTESLEKFISTLATCKGRQPVYTHVDPSFNNFIVRPLEGTMKDAKDYEVTFIDWSQSGWFPAYMQSIAFENKLILNHPYDPDDEEARSLFMQRLLPGLGDLFVEQLEVFEDIGRKLLYGIA